MPTLTLGDLMEPDLIVYSDGNGNVAPAPGIIAHAIELYNDELHGAGWTLFTHGYTGQYGYSGPIMHSSEYIGGRLERDIRETAGYYVFLFSHYSQGEPHEGHVTRTGGWFCETCDSDAYCNEPESIIEGWAIAYRETLEPSW